MSKNKGRKQQKKEAQRVKQGEVKRQKTLRKWISISVIGLALFFAGVYGVFFYAPSETYAGTLRITKELHNFGFVHVRGGVVNVEIPLVNIGEGPLTITHMETSCGCTKASVVTNGEEGPAFGMAGHGSNPKDWRTRIDSGEQATLKIYYDPAAHPDLRGQVTRVITVYSDDPDSPQQEVRIQVNQVD